MNNAIHQVKAHQAPTTPQADRTAKVKGEAPDGAAAGNPVDSSQVGQAPVAGQGDTVQQQARPEGAPSPKKMRLVATLDVDPDELGLGTINNDGQRQAGKTLALVPEDKLKELQSQGVYAPSIISVLSDENLGQGGRLEVTPVRAPDHPGDEMVVRQFEVPHDMTVKDSKTGHAPIEDFHVGLLPNEEHYVLFPDDIKKLQTQAFDKAVPPGFSVSVGTSKQGAQVQRAKGLIGGIATFGGMLTQASLLGFWSIPYAPIIATATGGFSITSQLDNMKKLYDQKAYAQHTRDRVGSDIIPWQMPDGTFSKVSYDQVSKQLRKQLIMSQAGLASSASLLTAGVSALVGATAWTPWIAGAGLAMGLGSNVVDTVHEMKDLAAEKKHLLELKGEGKSTVKKTVQSENGMVETDMPIDTRLDQIKAQQRRGALMMAGLAGGVTSAVGTFGLGMSALTALPISLIPMGGLVAFNSVRDMSKLRGERKELEQLQKQGQSTVKRTIMAPSGKFVDVDYPIDTRLKEIDTKLRGKKVVLSAVAAGGLFMGATAGLGLSALAAAPVVLIPAAMAVALFPKQTKALLKSVWQGIQKMVGRLLHHNKAAQVPEGLGRAPLDKKLSPAETKMVEAFQQLKAADPEAAARLNHSLAIMNGRFAEAPKTPEDAQAAMLDAGKDFQSARKELQQKAPEALAAWDQAREGRIAEFAQAAVKQDEAQQLLHGKDVTEALKQTGADEATAESVLAKILTAQMGGGTEELEAIDKQAEAGDPQAKKEQAIAAALNKEMVASAAADNGKPAHFDNPEERHAAIEDHVNQALADPTVQAALASPAFHDLLSRDQVDEKFVKHAFADLAAADIDPSIQQQLHQQAEAGDAEAKKEIQVAQDFVGLLRKTGLELAQKAQAQAPKLPPEQVDAMVQKAVSSDFSRTMAKVPEVVAARQQLGADDAMMHDALDKLYRADITHDASQILELQKKADAGDQHATTELRLLGVLQQAGQALMQAQQQAATKPAA